MSYYGSTAGVDRTDLTVQQTATVCVGEDRPPPEELGVGFD
jgi:hypothetical protein